MINRSTHYAKQLEFLPCNLIPPVDIPGNDHHYKPNLVPLLLGEANIQGIKSAKLHVPKSEGIWPRPNSRQSDLVEPKLFP